MTRAVGDWFDDYQDQCKMFEILEMTERDHARPTRRVRDQMVRAWRWPIEDMASHQVMMTDAPCRNGYQADAMTVSPH